MPTAGHDRPRHRMKSSYGVHQITVSDEGSRRFSRIAGRAGPGLGGVAVRLTGGTRVRASCAKGWLLAWWPGSRPLAAVKAQRSRR